MGIIRISSKDLDRYKRDSIKASRKAIKANRDTYHKLVAEVTYINNNVVDISEWRSRALVIADDLNTLCDTVPGTYFYSPMKNICPDIYGTADTMRSICKELAKVFELLATE